jgi:hypothetical protein
MFTALHAGEDARTYGNKHASKAERLQTDRNHHLKAA